jgi:hypothetical protein
MPVPGDVYYLPPELAEGPTKGDRPHVLLSICGPASETVTLAYGSTKDTDAFHGAAHVRVAPSLRNGFTRPTYVYPSRLLSLPIDELPPPSGRIVDALPDLRRALLIALGFGAGVTTERNAHGSNRRGRIAVYAPLLAADLGTSLGLIITEPFYSTAALQQITIPLLRALEHEQRSGDVRVRRGDWLTPPSERDEMLIATSMVLSVYEREWIVRYTSAVVGEETMAKVEAALGIHFGL